jgi:hypothetical protein
MSRLPPQARVLNLLLTHQAPAPAAAMLHWWTTRGGSAADDLLVVYGGTRESFEGLDHPQKVFVDDARLRTRDHQRQRQSYHAVCRAAAAWLEENAAAGHTHVYLAEFDHVPLVADLNRRQLEALTREGADVLGLRCLRIDGTSHPHYLYHAADPAFHEFWRGLSCRADPAVVLTMFGTGSFWTRAAFVATAEAAEPVPIYLELFLPTAAHHLGYRVRPYPDAAAHAFVDHVGDYRARIPEAEAAGAWTIHPVKTLWDEVPSHF